MGRQPLAQIYLDALDLSEYVIINYNNRNIKKVNFYVAYYESQRKGESIHSPATCLPGSGWSFDQSGTVKITNVPGSNETMEVNRLLCLLSLFRFCLRSIKDYKASYQFSCKIQILFFYNQITCR